MGDVVDPSGFAHPAQLPMACTLGADDGPSRLQRWQHLLQIAAPTPETHQW